MGFKDSLSQLQGEKVICTTKDLIYFENGFIIEVPKFITDNNKNTYTNPKYTDEAEPINSIEQAYMGITKEDWKNVEEGYIESNDYYANNNKNSI